MLAENSPPPPISVSSVLVDRTTGYASHNRERSFRSTAHQLLPAGLEIGGEAELLSGIQNNGQSSLNLTWVVGAFRSLQNYQTIALNVTLPPSVRTTDLLALRSAYTSGRERYTARGA